VNVSLGSVGQKELLPEVSKIPENDEPFFKPALQANGLLDTIEPRWHAKISSKSLSLSGFQQVPYFLTNFTMPEQFNHFITETIHHTVSNLSGVDTSSIESDTLGDIERAKTLGKLQEAYAHTPYGGKLLYNNRYLFRQN
jgi:hypothetical protein